MRLFAALAAACATVSLAGMMGGSAVAQSSSPLTLSRPGGSVAHFFPTHRLAKELGLIRRKGEAPPPYAGLVYHGGPVMYPSVHFYVIYWQPSTLQDGSATTISPGYKTVETGLVTGYPGHAISANNTQYSDLIGGVRHFITGLGSLDANITDTQPYPVSGCDPSIGPNCITDAQLRAEIQRLMTVHSWPGGLNRMFVVFTSSGEGSCFDNTTESCSVDTANVTAKFCAYHSYFGSNVIYSNEPFGNPNLCLGSGTQPNLGTGGAESDPAATAASHEISEALTDPLLNAWYDSGGNEIGDICAYQYGTNTWDSGLANQLWFRYFELQEEYDQHEGACVLAGPF